MLVWVGLQCEGGDNIGIGRVNDVDFHISMVGDIGHISISMGDMSVLMIFLFVWLVCMVLMWVVMMLV